jgi:hypothetical protein
MSARTLQSPIESPKDEDQTQPKPAMQREFRFFNLNLFGFDICCHFTSVHREMKYSSYLDDSTRTIYNDFTALASQTSD